MSFIEKVRELLGNKSQVPTSANLPKGPIVSNTSKIKTINKKVPYRYIVAKRNCKNCKGTGKINTKIHNEQEVILCMCRKFKKANSLKWSRKYWNVIETVSEKEINQTVEEK